MEQDIKNAVSLQGKTVFVFIGSQLRADDGVGPYIGESLKTAKSDVKLINAFSVIENYVDEIINFAPEKLIVIDAAFFNGRPGELKVLPVDKLSSFKIVSTHSFPLEAVLKIIKEDLPNLDIKIIGVEPLNIDYREGLSEEVKKAADLLIAEIGENI